MVDTLLVISGNGVPPYAGRGLTQTLEPIDIATNLRRTVNGGLVDLSADQFKKYKTAISCSDVDGIALEGVWPGVVLTVDCVSELSYPDGGTPQRTVVDGSVRSEAGFTFYRPQLIMIVTKYSLSTDEYGAAVSWQLELEEA